MGQPLSSLTRWVVRVLAGLETGPIADLQASGFLDVDRTFAAIDIPGARGTHALDINDAGHIVGSFTGSIVPEPGPLVLFSIGLLGVGLFGADEATRVEPPANQCQGRCCACKLA